MRWRAVATLCCIAALCFAVGDRSASAASKPGRAVSWLVPGDSFTSGHGTPTADGSRCQLSDQAWPYRAEQALGSDLALIQDGFVFVPCSGATTDKFDDQWDGTSRHDLVTFTFGGDDVGFADVLTQCVVGGAAQTENPFLWLHDSVSSCPNDSTVRKRIEALGPTYRTFLRHVAEDATTPGGNIVVMGYPDLFAEPRLWRGVAATTNVCNGVTDDDVHRIRGWAGDLNATIGQVVKELNGNVNNVHITFLNVDDVAAPGLESSLLWEPPGSSKVHTLCGNDEPWLNGLHKPKGFHPNQAGLDAEGKLAAQLIRQLDWNDLQDVYDLNWFITPSGNIACKVDDEGSDPTDRYTRCDVREFTWANLPPRPRDCDLDWGGSIYVNSDDTKAVIGCHGDTVLYDAAEPYGENFGYRTGVLPYGAVSRVGTFECRSETTGVECINTRTRHGFTISRSSFSLR